MYWQLSLGLIAVIAIAIVVLIVIRQQSGESSTTSQAAAKYGYSVWRSTKDDWQMTEDLSATGCAPGPKPAHKARFEGQCLRVISVRRH